jgi:hypothetical protein
MIRSEIINRLKVGPTALFLGQDYNSMNSRDPLLEGISKKYFNGKELTYNDLIDLYKKEKNQEAVQSWIHILCQNINNATLVSSSMINFPWSHVFTSAFNSNLTNAFENSSRTVQPMANNDFFSESLRSHNNLHISFLYGMISRIEKNEAVPFDFFEKRNRDRIAVRMMETVQKVITTRGILVIDGYDVENDWFSIEDFYSIISNTPINQVVFFGIKENWKTNPFLSKLQEDDKITLIKKSFSSFLEEAVLEKLINLEKLRGDDYLGHWLKIKDRRVRIPSSIYKRTKKAAIILEESLFNVNKEYSKADLYLEFKKFLSNSGVIPMWKGYKLGLAFKRTFQEELIKEALVKLKNISSVETPLIVKGQASSGKTIGLGWLAYELFNKGYPVIFIERRYQRIEHTDIDFFCQWCEKEGSTEIVIIWDGMEDVEKYQTLLFRLRSIGRKVIVIGSCYMNDDKTSNIEVNIDLQKNEIEQFTKFISKFDRNLSRLISNNASKHFLSLLYRYLPSTKSGIIEALGTELNDASQRIEQKAQFIEEDPVENLLINQLKIALGDNWSSVSKKALNEALEEEREVDNENVKNSKYLFWLIIVAGQYLDGIPYDILVRAVKIETFTKGVFNELSKIDLIRWDEDNLGNVLVRPRNRYEASLLVKRLGGTRMELEYINDLIKAVRIIDNNLDRNNSYEFEFLIQLLSHIIPSRNKNSNRKYDRYLEQIAQTLEEVRENGMIRHPRLTLKEANLLRSIARDKKDDDQEIDSIKLLEKAEKILREAIEQMEEQEENPNTINIYLYLQVELASILGTRTLEILKSNEPKEAAIFYNSVRTRISKLKSKFPSDFRLVDILAWTTFAIIEKGGLLEEEKLKARVELLHYFELAEDEGLSPNDYKKLNERKNRYGQIFGDEKISDEAFENLKKMNPAIAYYLRAKEKLHNVDLTGELSEQDINSCTDALEYLEHQHYHHYEDVKNDGRYLYLLFKVWWIFKSKTSLFGSVEQALPFKYEDWETCLSKINELLIINEELYSFPSLRYIKAVALFQLGQFQEATNEFQILSTETNSSNQGSRRLKKFYVMSDSSGKPLIFNGSSKYTQNSRNNHKGFLYVEKLRTDIVFFLTEFSVDNVRAKETINNFKIGFNFISPVAIPNK